MLNTGPDDHRNPTDMAEFEDVLQDCARHRLPMICANPGPAGDPRRRARAVRRLAGVALPGAGRRRPLASASRIRRSTSRCCNSLGLPVERVLAVGDALHTDIAGAAAVDLAACWVLGGIHGESAGGRRGRLRHSRRRMRLASAAGRRTGRDVPRFAW